MTNTEMSVRELLAQRVRVVLVGAQSAGNVGAAARAMKTMGLSQLWLVDPVDSHSSEAYWMAANATDVLTAARIVPDVQSAIADCVLVLGSSARDRRIQPQILAPRAAAERCAAVIPNGPAALLFGRETSGLTNDELRQCHYQVRIPANPEYSVLNLAMAVQIVCYELRLAVEATPPSSSVRDDIVPPATHAELAQFFAHLADTLTLVGVHDPAQPRLLLPRLQRLFGRAALDKTEVQLLRGILSAVQAHPRGLNSGPN